MTRGNVISTRKPLVPITIPDSIGNPHVLRVILDTGFTGQLLLPERYMRRLHTGRRRHRHQCNSSGTTISPLTPLPG